MFARFGKQKLNTEEAVERIQRIVYEAVKPYGFRRYGRTLHRFVDGDISQVIHFQNGCPEKGVHEVLWVNLGIRVPECAERTFSPAVNGKKYYQEYECNIRTRLCQLTDGEDRGYDLRKDPEKIGQEILGRLNRDVLPLYGKLTSREAILVSREAIYTFDHMNYRHMALLEEAMIYGRRGEWEHAGQLFNQYYRRVKAEQQENIGHLAYLEALAAGLGIPLGR